MSRDIAVVKKERQLYRVYKKVGDNLILKRTFYTLHQANRYAKGFKS